VIKPALVGLAGPWISGGVEFNWPKRHRPGTFISVNAAVEEYSDGSRTIWCTDHDPLNHALSLAPVTWVLIWEIFPNRVRGIAVSISVSVLRIASFLLTFTFPILNRTLGAAGTFSTYGAVCLKGFFFVFWRVPETKGRTLEQVERELAGTGNDRHGTSIRS
jgi:sugar transport protein